MSAEGFALLLHQLLGHDLGVAYRQDGNKGRPRFVEHDLDRVAVQSGQP